MEKKNVSFYGYNDGKAIEIYNCIQLVPNSLQRTARFG